ncbi:MAG: nodulation protein NfeD [Rikenellaceae bacterium]|nr:nodulation protein NfeD [Rikenellaceae bacterium]
MKRYFLFFALLCCSAALAPSLLCAETDPAIIVVKDPPVTGAIVRDSVRPGGLLPAAGAERPLVYVFPVRDEIMPSVVRLTDKCLREAGQMGADYVVIHLNTYGGLLDAADSIRTRILNSPIPVYVFIDNQAASAGALISIAADSIYMRPGGSIGAATVVDRSGGALPDKYQSFMRGMMRSTAEAHGKVPVVGASGDTTWRWLRDPLVAEAMVDPRVVVPGLVDSTKVLTLTADEAEAWGFSEGKARSVDEVLELAGIAGGEVYEYRPTTLDRIIGWLTHPAVQGVVIMLIVGGLYFELQTPGVGFPLAVAVLGACLYFAPLYLEGLVAHWDLILFLAGIVLIVLELFVTPGFGVLGIAGIAAVVLGLTFAMIDTDLLKYIPSGQLSASYVLRPVLVVVISIAVAMVLCLWLGRRFLTGRSRLRERVVLASSLTPEAGYVGRIDEPAMVGREGTVTTVLRPTGRIEIDGAYHEAASEDGFYIPRGDRVTVVRAEGGVLYCRKAPRAAETGTDGAVPGAGV